MITNKILSYFVSLLLCISICFNTKLSEAPPVFLSNIIILIIDTILLLAILVRLKSKIWKDINGVVILLILISIISFFSFGNKNVVSVVPKIILGILTYYSFSRFLLIYFQDIHIILFGICFGTALSPFFQIEASDLTSLNIANRIRVDNLGNFNAYAFLIAVSILMSIYLFSQIKLSLNKLLFIGSQLPLLVVLLLTLSRGGFFALIVGVILYNFSVNRKTKIYLFVFILIVIFCIVGLLIQTDSLDFFQSRFLNSENNEEFDSGRSIVYIYLLNDLLSSVFHFIFGFGFGAIDVRVFAESDILSAHNTYLDVFYSCGIIGLIVFIRYLFKVYSNIKIMPKSNDKSFLVALFGQVIFCFIYDSYWGATQIGWIFPFFFALIWALSKKKHSIEI